MATRFVLTPFSAEFPASNFPQLLLAGTAVGTLRPALAFDATTSETAYWTSLVPQGLTGTVSAVISYCMASGTAGGVAFDVALEAVTSADALDLDSASSYGAVNGGSDGTVPAVAGYMKQISITLTDTDSAAAADYLRISLARDVADGADTATGDCYVLAMEIRDGA